MQADCRRPIRRVHGKKPQNGELLHADSPNIAQDEGPRTFRSHELAPVKIPREAMVSLGTHMHAPTAEDGLGAGHHSSTISGDDCSADSSGHGNFVQHNSPCAPLSACVDDSSGEAAPFEPLSSTHTHAFFCLACFGGFYSRWA